MQDWFDPQRFPNDAPFRAEPAFRTPITMLTRSERQLLRWMARESYSGAGSIVELGCWMGGSTAALVTGLRENGRVADESKIVHTYDYFLWHPTFERYDLGFTRQVGESFQDEVERQLAPWRSSVALHAGDIAQAGWTGDPIEILFVDVMKDATSTTAAALTFFPHLIPNRSYLIHQDFKHHHSFWLHLQMFRLRTYFVPVLDVSDAATLVFQPSAPLPAGVIEAASDFDALCESEIDDAFDYSDSLITGSAPALVQEVRQARARAKDALLGGQPAALWLAR